MSTTTRNILAILVLAGAFVLAGCAPSRGPSDGSMASRGVTPANGAGQGVEDPRG